mgnify:CR=1 FL=1
MHLPRRLRRAFLPLQAEVFPDREHFGRIFYQRGPHVSAAGIRADQPWCWARARRAAPRARDERRGRHRRRAGHDLPRRAAAGEGGHRRRGHGRGAGRRRRRTRASAASPTTSPTTTSTRSRSRATIVSRLTARKELPAGGARRPRSRRTTPSEIYGSVVPRDLRKAYDVREVIARAWWTAARFDGVQGPLRLDARHRLRAPAWAFSSASSPTTACCSRSRALKATHFIELCSHARHAARLPAEHHRLHGRQGSTSSGGIAKDGAKMVHAVANAQCPEVHGHHRRLASAPGNYGMCGRRLRAARCCGCGRTRASPSWAASRPPACWPRSSASRLERQGTRHDARTRSKPSRRPILREIRGGGQPLLLDRRACGTTA